MNVFTVTIFLLWVAGVVGWIINLVHVINFLIAAVWPFEITGLFILQCVGVFLIPLGSILGLFF